MSHDRLNQERQLFSPLSKSEIHSFLTFDDYHKSSFISSRYIIINLSQRLEISPKFNTQNPMEFSPIITEYKTHPRFLNIDPKKLELKKSVTVFQSTPVIKIDKKFKCTCLKTKCLKKYCVCFLNGEICDENCECCDCSNLTIRDKQISVEAGFCKCVGSQCQKLYCECFKNGRACGVQCRCVSCKNKVNNFGIQHISVLILNKKIFIEESKPLLVRKRSSEVELLSTRDQSNKKRRLTNGLDSHADIKKRLKL